MVLPGILADSDCGRVVVHFFWHGIPLGVDFTGGTIITVKFSESGASDHDPHARDKAGVKDARDTGHRARLQQRVHHLSRSKRPQMRRRSTGQEDRLQRAEQFAFGG